MNESGDKTVGRRGEQEMPSQEEEQGLVEGDQERKPMEDRMKEDRRAVKKKEAEEEENFFFKIRSGFVKLEPKIISIFASGSPTKK